MLYFAYGSNLWKRGMSRRCPQARAVSAARLPGYRLVFRGYADLRPDAENIVFGALWRLTPACLRALDSYENAPRLYRRSDVTVLTDDGALTAFTYFMNADAVRRGDAATPDPAYYGEIARGYNDWKLDPAPLRRARFAAAPEPRARRASGAEG